eukprot:6188751-Pleurochrysis_carterae.AAC.1
MPSSTRSAKSARRRPPSERASTRCRLQSTILRLEANGREGPAGPAQEAQSSGQDWLCALPAKAHGVCVAAADAAPRSQRGRERPRRRRFRHRWPKRLALRDCPRSEAQARTALLLGLRMDRGGEG